MVARTGALGHSCFWRASQLFLRPGLWHVVLDTSQPTQVFYGHVGFVVREIMPGAHGHVWSSAGVTACIDLTLSGALPRLLFQRCEKAGFCGLRGHDHIVRAFRPRGVELGHGGVGRDCEAAAAKGGERAPILRLAGAVSNVADPSFPARRRRLAREHFVRLAPSLAIAMVSQVVGPASSQHQPQGTAYPPRGSQG